MKWKQPPVSKIYEALGAVADGRLILSGNSAKVYSSSRNKFYTVTFEPETQAIMVNDNASFYHGYLGYPAIAFLMMIGELHYSPSTAQLLKGIAWKDINQKFNNDFQRALDAILDAMTEMERRELESEVQTIDSQLRAKRYRLLGEKVRPPEGY